MVYWSTSSMILYVIMGIISMSSIMYVKKIEKYKYRKILDVGTILFIWFLIWIFITIFRKVDIDIGGSDAITYKEFFEDALNPYSTNPYVEHADVGFSLLTKGIRLISSNYHFYFFIIYSIILISYIVFIYEFMPPSFSAIPMVLVFFLFLRGFTTLRTNISVAFMLLSFVSLKRKHYLRMVLFIILSLSMHVASFLCLPFYAFYFLYKNKQVKLSHWIVLYGLVFLGISIIQPLLTSDFLNLGGAYASYADYNTGSTLLSFFFEGGWKIAFGPLLLFGMFIIFHKYRNLIYSKLNDKDKNRYQFVYLMCCFDFLMLPVYYKLGIWRGYEYFYIPRLIMWGGIINCVSEFLSKDNRCKHIVNAVACVAFISWMVFRIYNTYEDSCLMPYIFQLIGG